MSPILPLFASLMAIFNAPMIAPNKYCYNPYRISSKNIKLVYDHAHEYGITTSVMFDSDFMFLELNTMINFSARRQKIYIDWIMFSNPNLKPISAYLLVAVGRDHMTPGTFSYFLKKYPKVHKIADAYLELKVCRITGLKCGNEHVQIMMNNISDTNDCDLLNGNQNSMTKKQKNDLFKICLRITWAALSQNQQNLKH